MLTLLGPANSGFCDRLSRRSFLQLGSLLGTSISLPTLLANDARPNSAAPRHKSLIMVYLSGGMSHQDTFDLKPLAPAEIRGEFRPIPTNVPGIQISEQLPRLAKIMDRYSVIRSIVGLRDEHSSFQNLTGHTIDVVHRDRKPNLGSIISRIEGPTSPVTPPFVDLFPTMQHRPYNSSGAGYLGARFNQVRVDGEDLASMKLRFVDESKFRNRQSLLKEIDAWKQAEHKAANLSENYSRAFDVLTSSRLVDAMDVEKEKPELRERYGKGSPTHVGDGAPMWNDQLLIARRLVEAGVRVVTVAYGFWDTHGNNFGHLKQHLPLFDQGISALIEDIHARGLENDVSVLVWGEFGRTPKINANAGRDHWAPVNFALLAGGGMRHGQMIGTTDKSGAYAETRPIHYRDILATVCQSLGIDPHSYVRDISDRPVPILPEDSRIVRELFA